MNADGSIKHLIPEGGYIDETRSDKNSYTLRAQINFNRTFDEKHEVSAIAGGERRAVHSTSTYVEKYGYDKVSLAHKYLDEATLNQTQQGTEAINNSYTHVPNGYPDTFGEKRTVTFRFMEMLPILMTAGMPLRGVSVWTSPICSVRIPSISTNLCGRSVSAGIWHRRNLWETWTGWISFPSVLPKESTVTLQNKADLI